MIIPSPTLTKLYKQRYGSAMGYTLVVLFSI